MDENENKFKSEPIETSYRKVSNYRSKPENKSGFGKSVIIPFFSGVIGCSLVLGVCFGVPSIKQTIFGKNFSTSANNYNSSANSGTVDYISLEKYSDTSVYSANKILPSIVGIEVEYNVSTNSIFSMFGADNRSTSTATASGSGIIISEDGYILTNNHVVATSANNSYYEVSDATKVTVTLYNDETSYEAKIIGKDEETDLAVIKIDKSGLTAAEFADSDSVKVGEFAMAVGNPLGMTSSITCGVVSALNREVSDSDGKTGTYIQTDAAINSGNSGGALVNSQGQVIGINDMKVSATGVEGMGFAIPINSTLDIIDQLIEYNKVKRPYIGISGVDLDEKTAEYYKLVIGVYVKSIDDFSAAEKAGLKIGDVIIKADGKDIKTMDELNEIKASHKIGDELKITVNRDGQEKELTIILGEQP